MHRLALALVVTWGRVHDLIVPYLTSPYPTLPYLTLPHPTLLALACLTLPYLSGWAAAPTAVG